MISRRALCALLLVPACGGSQTAVAPSARAPWFEDVAVASGIDFTHSRGFEQRYWYPEIIGSGLGFLDYDRDGDLDLFLVQAGDLDPEERSVPSDRLYRNEGDGTFTDVTEAAGVGDRSYGMGCAVGDYDGDGDPDLYVTNLGPNVLYRNDGDGSFTDVTRSAGVGCAEWSLSAAFMDLDGDLDLDLFVANYIHWTPATEIDCRSHYGTRDYCEPVNYNAPAPAVYYRNEGDGTFHDASLEVGLDKVFGNGMGVVCGDFDRDGRVDVYVANDGMPNQLWRNTGRGFEDVSLLAGCAVDVDGHAEASMGLVAVDYDEDGDLDLFSTHLRGETNTLYVNKGGGSFADRTAQAGMTRAGLPFTGFGVGFVDFDLDGALDVHVANGRVGYWRPVEDEERPYAEPDQVFRGVGDGRFEEVLPRGGTSVPDRGNSRGSAYGDYDNDGDVDVAVLDNHSGMRLLRNVAPRRGHWILLRVLERTGADALGADVTALVGGRTRFRRVDPAYSYCAANDPRVHLGLGAASEVAEVRVRWSDGAEEVFGPLQADRIHDLRRGTGR